MIKFVSYTGAYPNLCDGVLTVKINGKTYRFGHDYEFYDYKTNTFTNEKKTCNFDAFWRSGGCCRGEYGNIHAESGDWLLSIGCKYPDWLTPLFPELIELFNKNVSQGCCGGCI